MASIASAAFFKATVGLLVSKGRDVAAEKLKHGDVTDQKFRSLIVREINDIKSKLDGLARMNLLASMEFFKEGLVSLYKVFDQTDKPTSNADEGEETEKEKLAVSLQVSTGGLKSSVSTDSLVTGLKNLELTFLDNHAKKSLADAKKSFEDARKEATRAFSNEALKIFDRILAMKVRIMATLLQEVDNPAHALATCKLCIDELNTMPAVQKTFRVKFVKGFKSLFNKDERGELIAAVCHVNRVIYSVTHMVGTGGGHGGDDFFFWPGVDIGEKVIDILHDPRVAKKLRHLDMEHCCLPKFSFGQSEKKDSLRNLSSPGDIATNTQGQFIVADSVNVKVFSSNGTFKNFLHRRQSASEEISLLMNSDWNVVSVATDQDDNVYVLSSFERAGLAGKWEGVYLFNRFAELLHSFPLRKGSIGRSVTVSDCYQAFVLVLRAEKLQVEVYERYGQFLHSFTPDLPSITQDITAADGGSVMLLDPQSLCVHMFSAQGDHLHQFSVQGKVGSGALAFHPPSGYIIVSSQEPESNNQRQVSIYNKHGRFVRVVQFDIKEDTWLAGVTATMDGRIAAISFSDKKVYVV